MSIVKRIEELCLRDGISMAELERRLGFGNSTVRKWDKSFPSVDKILKVSEYFHVTMEYIVKGKISSNGTNNIAARKFDSLTKEEMEAVENMIDFYIARKKEK